MPRKKDDANLQADRFKQMAKEVGADESEAAFEGKLKQLAQANLKKADKK